MDGSIADSAIMRMRSGLSRAYQPSANSTANDFFEELLRLPVASTVKVKSKEPAGQAEPTDLLDAPKSSAETDREPKADQAEDDEAKQPEDAAGCLGGSCYTAWQSNRDYPVDSPPAGDQPPSSVPVADRPELPSGDTQAPALEPISAGAQAPEAAETTAVPEVLTAQGQEVAAEGPSTSQGTPAATGPSKDARRFRQRDEKFAEPTIPPPPQAQSVAKVGDAHRPAPEADQKTSDAQLVAPDKASLPASETLEATRAADQDGREPQREKWYEGRTGENNSAVEQLLADQSGGQSSGDEAELKDEASWQELIGQNAATTTDALTSPEAAAGLSAGSDQSPLAATLSAVGLTNSSSATEGPRKAADAAVAGAAGRVTGAAGNNGGAAGSYWPAMRGGGSPSSQASPRSQAPREEVDAQQLTQQERVRLVQRVARSFSRLGPEGGQVTLKLSPPQLGVLNVSIKIEGQTMTARLQTETAAARDTILENLPVLRERLGEHGIEVEKFQVEVSSEDNSSGGQGQAGDTSSGGTGGGTSGGRNESRNEAVDYRRLRRDAAPPPHRQREPGEELRVSGWPSRSLDVRA